MLHRHEQDLYRGNGKPGITSRLNTLEDAVEAIRKDVAVIEDQVAGFHNFVTELRTQTKVYQELDEKRDKRNTLFVSVVGVLIALMMAILTILGIEHATGKAVIDLKSDVLNAERLAADPWR